jgi:hypothetical protein
MSKLRRVSVSDNPLTGDDERDLLAMATRHGWSLETDMDVLATRLRDP